MHVTGMLVQGVLLIVSWHLILLLSSDSPPARDKLILPAAFKKFSCLKENVRNFQKTVN